VRERTNAVGGRSRRVQRWAVVVGDPNLKTALMTDRLGWLHTVGVHESPRSLPSFSPATPDSNVRRPMDGYQLNRHHPWRRDLRTAAKSPRVGRAAAAHALPTRYPTATAPLPGRGETRTIGPPARRLPAGPTRRVGDASPVAQRIAPAVRPGPPCPARPTSPARPRRRASAVMRSAPPGGRVNRCGGQSMLSAHRGRAASRLTQRAVHPNDLLP
jgi:hypothetical protein